MSVATTVNKSLDLSYKVATTIEIQRDRFFYFRGRLFEKILEILHPAVRESEKTIERRSPNYPARLIPKPHHVTRFPFRSQNNPPDQCSILKSSTPVKCHLTVKKVSFLGALHKNVHQSQ
jgi:hypothetical protein